uniref:Uncharacterized protein n=1 Tax=Bicosoecida sp. CB-2014 TaxID=1486930 RepID=A0A7S1CTB6_9STRA|mmetsp:Transcript_9438/g.33192  ORF Transcript_9438/g.33192 Transcript_9438/m.33192 type:complete len:244 (+) Transcript_9438:290-1021(+)
MEFGCGGLAGFIEVAATHPLDVCKTRLQAGLPLRFNVPTLYRGAVPRLIGVIPMRVVFWGSSFWFKKHLPIEDDVRRALAAGALAGSLQTTIDTPIEVLKIKQIAGDEVAARGAARLQAGYFAGFWATLARNVGFATSMCFFTFGLPPSVLPPAIAPGVGALIGSVATQPIDTIKTIQQSGQALPPLRELTLRRLFSGTTHRAAQGMVAMVIGGFVMRACDGRMRSHERESETVAEEAISIAE